MLCHITRCWIASALLIGLTACGAGVRDDSELPLVGIDGLSRDGDRITLVLSLRNLNPQNQRFDPSLLELKLNETQLLSWSGPGGTELGARGREALTVSGPAQPAGLEALDRLAEGTRNVAWTLQVTVADARGREQVIESSGFLHRVPGRANQFR